MEEEPNTVGKEEVRLRSQDDDSEQIMRVFKIAFQVEGAELRDEELQVVPEDAVEIRVDPALLKVFDGALLMSVHPHHGLGHDLALLALAPVLYIEPLFEPGNESLLGDFFGLLAEETTAEHVVEATTSPEQTCLLGVHLLFWNNII